MDFQIKKIFASSVLILGIIASSAVSYAGGSGTGGGDSLLCKDGHYYSYDYVLTEGDGSRLNPKFVAAKSYKTILFKIAAIMETKLPNVASDLKDYIAGLKNTNLFNPNATRVWSFGKNPLVPLNDESRLRDAPNCKNASGQLQIFQTVVRKTGDRIEYNADQALMNKLAENSPIQLSFLHIHEWLRDYTQNPEVIMKVDRILHETDWISASPEDVRRVLVSVGLESFAGEMTPKEKAKADAMDKAFGAAHDRYNNCLKNMPVPSQKLDECHRKMVKISERGQCLFNLTNDLEKIDDYTSLSSAIELELYEDNESSLENSRELRHACDFLGR